MFQSESVAQSAAATYKNTDRFMFFGLVKIAEAYRAAHTQTQCRQKLNAMSDILFLQSWPGGAPCQSGAGPGEILPCQSAKESFAKWTFEMFSLWDFHILDTLWMKTAGQISDDVIDRLQELRRWRSLEPEIPPGRLNSDALGLRGSHCPTVGAIHRAKRYICISNNTGFK